MGKHIFCEQNISQVTKRGRYLAKYRPNLLGTQFACLRPGRSETVSSPSDTGDLDHSVYHMHYSTGPGKFFFLKLLQVLKNGMLQEKMGKNLVRNYSIFSPV